MAGYSSAKRLVVLATTIFLPLLAIALYQAVQSNWYARGSPPFMFHQHPGFQGDEAYKCPSRDLVIVEGDLTTGLVGLSLQESDPRGP